MRNPLEKTLRSALERTMIAARETAEAAAREVLEQLGVPAAKAPEWLTPEQSALRRALRARARALGGELAADGSQKIAALVEEIAYEQWNRMVFARFLAENGLLAYEGVPVTLEDCAALAEEGNLGSAWDVAADCAAQMLPNVFRTESLSFRVKFAANRIKELESLVAGLDPATFQASDSLGWIYQHWQTKKKAAVNASEVKIGADELAPVTQLFTEPYMVSFLLDNTLGAWYAAPKLVGKTFASEAEARAAVATPEIPLAYLRLVPETGTAGTDEGRTGAPRTPCAWKPAAGSFEKWPTSLAEFSMLDPSCGSGHFCVAAFLMLVPMRMELEGLDATTAVDRVLAENIHALELDRRCVEIAAFAVALEAWRYPGTSGYRKLPTLHIACDGIAPRVKRDEWIRLARRAARKAGRDGAPSPSAEEPESLFEANLVRSMGKLWDYFQQAPILGSLISPDLFDGDLFYADYSTLAEVLAEHFDKATDEEKETAIAAQGIIQAMQLLGRKYTLVTTNVPYLALGKQNPELAEFCSRNYQLSKSDLATVFLERCLRFTASNSDARVAVVLPQNWLFLTNYKQFREELLRKNRFDVVARLGFGSFDTPMFDFNIQLLVMSNHTPNRDDRMNGIDASAGHDTFVKSEQLLGNEIVSVLQSMQLRNPDTRITHEEISCTHTLGEYAKSYQGIKSGDDNRLKQNFWESEEQSSEWRLTEGSLSKISRLGYSYRVNWHENGGLLARLQGVAAFAKRGISITTVGRLVPMLHGENVFASELTAIIPAKREYMLPIYSYACDPSYEKEIRRIDQKLGVTNATFLKVPFDLERWQKVAAEKYPNGLPAPFTDDPTQWIFHGHPCGSVVWDETAKKLAIGTDRVDATVLQVAVARLMGYKWPSELDAKMELADEMRTVMARNAELEEFVDNDGIVCVPALNGEESAAARLTALLAKAYGADWNAAKLEALLEACGAGGKTLEEWLRKDFFLQHAKLFGSRPFIWQIWDGLRDGFSVLVNYHTFDRKALETLIYSYLGDWITRQNTDLAAGVPGAGEKLDRAKELKGKLEKILEGEAPYDIFVRWKSLAEQPVGWNPDLNDGVRLNIRPFCEAGVLREKAQKLNIKWAKDRGKDVASAPWYKVFNGDRINDHHTTLAEKKAAKDL